MEQNHKATEIIERCLLRFEIQVLEISGQAVDVGSVSLASVAAEIALHQHI